jgi:hypothetical protein
MAASNAKLHNPLKRIFTLGGSATLAALFFFWLPLRRRTWRTLFSLLMFSAIAAAAIGCIHGIAANVPANSGTTAGNYTVTVTGTSGSANVTTAVNVTVE